MSYSRWTTSRWYTYWCVAQGDAVENRDIARFSVNDARGADPWTSRWFAAAEIRENIDECVGKFLGASVGELQELKGYMLQFLEEVDAHYPEHARC